MLGVPRVLGVVSGAPIVLGILEPGLVPSSAMPRLRDHGVRLGLKKPSGRPFEKGHKKTIGDIIGGGGLWGSTKDWQRHSTPP
jgi:hypothetical protein